MERINWRKVVTRSTVAASMILGACAPPELTSTPTPVDIQTRTPTKDANPKLVGCNPPEKFSNPDFPNSEVTNPPWKDFADGKYPYGTENGLVFMVQKDGDSIVEGWGRIDNPDLSPLDTDNLANLPKCRLMSLTFSATPVDNGKNVVFGTFFFFQDNVGHAVFYPDLPPGTKPIEQVTPPGNSQKG